MEHQQKKFSWYIMVNLPIDFFIIKSINKHRHEYFYGMYQEIHNEKKIR
jgi:hypothetical protein